MMPTAAINPGASKVNGFTKEDGILYKNGIPVENVQQPKEVLQNFVKFLREMDVQVDLVAHNAFGFDGPVLSNNFKKFGVQYGTSIRYGYFTQLLLLMLNYRVAKNHGKQVS